MNKRHHELFHPASFVLSRDNYDDLCMIRDKLLLLAQLAGTNTSNGDHDFEIGRASCRERVCAIV